MRDLLAAWLTLSGLLHEAVGVVGIVDAVLCDWLIPSLMDGCSILGRNTWWLGYGMGRNGTET